MKRIPIGLSALILALALLTACGGSEAKTIDKYSATYAEEAKVLNYFLIPDVTGQRVAANTQDQLVENDRFGRFVPALAESWTISPDNLVWTFKLRQGQYWVDHTGAKTQYEVTADDFVAGFRYVSDPKNGIRNVRTVRSVIKGLYDYYYNLIDFDDGVLENTTREQLLADFDKNVGVKALDKYTVQYTLDQITPFFLSYLTMDVFFPVEKAFIDQLGQDFGTAADRLLYSGGYYLSSWQRDKEIVMTKNEHYWDAENITAKTVHLQKSSDSAVELQMFMRGELSSATLTADQVQGITGTAYRDKVYMSDLSSVTFWWHPNFASDNPEFAAFIRNENFRKAMFYGIDHVKLLSLDDPVNPLGLMRTTIIPEENCFDENGKDYTDYPGVREWKQAGNPYDPAKARDYFAKALAELTDGNGNINGVQETIVNQKPVVEFKVDGKLPLQMVYVHSAGSRSTTQALLFQAMMQEMFQGQVEVVLGQFVDDDYDEVILPNRYDMMYSSLRFSYADPLAQFGRIVEDDGLLNVAVDSAAARERQGFYDPEIKVLIDQAAAETVLSKRYELFAKAENLMLQRAYLIPFRAGGGSYTIGNVVPYTMPRGGFGVTRFKYKGMQIENEPLTEARVRQLREQFYKDLEVAVGAKK
ncbi:MAG: peptide ABC transporter substrate-binding protein [Spirochaetes bacterium]|nr:peptide ABC transporter substrate-binding protein [Spirochaetota bacterium]MBU0956659.1 peptide ABC transporter substrate-binding protein [Spirochaetota bacterium]